MSLAPETIDKLAAELYDAEQSCSTIEGVIDRYADLALEDAFAIGERVAARYEAAGCRLVGWKLANSRIPLAPNALLTRPVKGPIFDRNIHDESEPLSLQELIAPRIEPEICFVLGQDLAGPGVMVAQVLAATRGVVPAFEIVDARQRWNPDLRNVIADNVCHARLVTAGRLVSPDAVDLRYIGCVLERNGELVGTGAGAAVLGHPARAVAYLANELGAAGRTLRAGDLITTGSLVTPASMAAGDVWTATFGGLGHISLRVTE